MTYIAIDEHNVEGKKLVAFLKTQSYIEILEEPNAITKKAIKDADAGKVKLMKTRESSSPAKNNSSRSSKQKFLNGFKEAIEELNQIKAGTLKGIAAKDLLNGL